MEKSTLLPSQPDINDPRQLLSPGDLEPGMEVAVVGIRPDSHELVSKWRGEVWLLTATGSVVARVDGRPDDSSEQVGVKNVDDLVFKTEYGLAYSALRAMGLASSERGWLPRATIRIEKNG